MLLIVIIPVVLSLFIFERINSFNQNLQQEAVESIDIASEIYRTLIKSESDRIRLIKKDLSIQVDTLLAKHHVTRISEVRLSVDFRDDLKTLFEETMNDDELVADIQLVYNMEPIVHVGQKPDAQEDYRYHVEQIPVNIRTRYGNRNVQNVEVDDDAIPMLIAEPVDHDDPPQEVTRLSLPNNLAELETAGQPIASTQGIYIAIVFGIERAQLAQYSKLGDRRYLHDSISAVEKDGGMNVTEIYQLVFMIVSIIVILLTAIGAIYIALSLSRRLTAMTNSMQRVAEGDLSAKVAVTGNDQVAFMMTQYNHMIDDVRTAQESKAYIERTKAWREVARRLAHEIKNPLTPIVLAIQQLDKKFEDYTERPQKYRKLLTDVVEIVNEETETLRKLVKNFTEFARMPIPERREGCFFDFVTQTVNQNPQFLEAAKRITVHPAEGDLKTRELSYDSELMRRVIVNIVRNGIEAAQNDHIDPEIDIDLSNVEEPPQNSKITTRLRIIDNGPGLTEDQKSKLFMPYFTTKSDGTGLGLPIVRKIVEDHDGMIQIHDRDDHKRGTQVDILL